MHYEKREYSECTFNKLKHLKGLIFIFYLKTIFRHRRYKRKDFKLLYSCVHVISPLCNWITFPLYLIIRNVQKIQKKNSVHEWNFRTLLSLQKRWIYLQIFENNAHYAKTMFHENKCAKFFEQKVCIYIRFPVFHYLVGKLISKVLMNFHIKMASCI